MTLVQTMDFVVRPWPYSVCPCNAAVRVDMDGRANIYVNPNLSLQATKTALMHELRHVQLDHAWQTGRSRDELQREAQSAQLISTVVDTEGNTIFSGKVGGR